MEKTELKKIVYDKKLLRVNRKSRERTKKHSQHFVSHLGKTVITVTYVVHKCDTKFQWTFETKLIRHTKKKEKENGNYFTGGTQM